MEDETSFDDIMTGACHNLINLYEDYYLDETEILFFVIMFTPLIMMNQINFVEIIKVFITPYHIST